MRRLRPALLALSLAACTCGPDQPPVIVHAPEDLPIAMQRAVDDLVADLRQSGAEATRVATNAPACVEGEVHVAVLGHAKDDGASGAAIAEAQAYAIREQRCDDGGRRIALRGGSLLSAQWAVYDLLDRLGVRYLHPERTLYPAIISWPESLAVEARPFFRERSMHAHRTHPIELDAPLVAEGLDMPGYQKRWIDWNVKLRQTSLDGWDAAFAGTWAYERGFPRGGGFNLLNSQQGGRPLLDPDDPRSEEEQIAEAIAEQMTPREGLPPLTQFGFQFNPSEFTEADDRDTVRRLTYIADYFREHHPEVRLETINHGTHGAPTSFYGVRFFDLSQFAPANLGVKVHTLMFYDLERPAPVYGNEDFRHLLAWSRAEAKKRRITHYPESSWWLTFDLPVPLYLAPVTLEARQRDLDLLADLASKTDDATTGVYGHHVFTSGQEWGYWLVDWCVARMAWDRAYTHAKCLDDFTGSLAGGKEIRVVLEEVEAAQMDAMRNPELIRYLVGSDDATEAAWDAGIRFHPLPPQPKELLAWDDARAAALERESLAPLRDMARKYADWTRRIDATLPKQTAAQAPWVREIRDGLGMFGLRAEHAAEVYETALELRAALKANDLGKVREAAAGVDRAKALTDRATTVVRAREKDYRYPEALTIAGDEPGTPGALPNSTVYPYRYLSRTHRMFYWKRPDQQLAALFGEGLDAVRPSRRVLKRPNALEVKLLAEGVTDLDVTWGDGTNGAGLEPHAYAREGFFEWVLDARVPTGAIHHADEVAVVSRRFVFPRGSLRVEEPSGAALLTGLLPGFVVGFGEDGGQFLALGRLDGEETIATQGTLQRRARAGTSSPAADLVLELRNVGRITVRRAVLDVDDGGAEPTLEITGAMRTNDVIDLLVQVGGFDRPGAVQITADVLGVTPDTLPDEVDFLLRAKGREED